MNVRHVQRDREPSVWQQQRTHAGHLNADQQRAALRARITLPRLKFLEVRS